MEEPEDVILIRDLSARGIIGINDWEREKAQEILINLWLYIDLRRAGASDLINETISYSSVAKKVRAHAESAARLTVEALATDLAKLCLAEPGVRRVRVQVEKPGAVRFTRSVGVVIERTATDFPA